jgi:pilus assembly protein Flp/PilA
MNVISNTATLVVQTSVRPDFSALLRDFFASENGVTAIEYGLIAALIAVGLVVLFSDAGKNLSFLYERVADCLLTPTGPKCNP